MEIRERYKNDSNDCLEKIRKQALKHYDDLKTDDNADLAKKNYFI